jgi:hypothetical protein
MIKDNELKAIAENLLEQHAQDSSILVGVRTIDDSEMYEVGDDASESFGWDYEQDMSMFDVTGETAGFTCATGINDYQPLDGNPEDKDDIDYMVDVLRNAVDFNFDHYGYEGATQVILFGEDSGEDGNDERELDLVNAKVMAIFLGEE